MLPAFTPQVDNRSLIQCVQSYEVLYDGTHAQYSDARHKEDLWEKIAYVMAIPVSLCKRSWFNLRDSYRRALRKRRDAFRDNLPYRKWRYEDEMHFLEPHISIREPNDRVDSQLALLVLPEERVTDPLDLEPKAKKPRDRTSCKKAMPTSTENYEPRYLNTDHIDAFLMGIGATLKNFTARNQNLAKTKIFSLVAEMELQQITEYKENWTDTGARMFLEAKKEEKGSEPEGSEPDGERDTNATIPKIQLDEDRGSRSLSEEGMSTSEVEIQQNIKKEKSFDEEDNCDPLAIN